VSKNRKKPNLPPVTGARRELGAERRAAAAQLMQQQKRRHRRRTVLVQAAIGLVVVIAVVATTLVVLSQRDDDNAAASTPPGLTADGAVRFGADDVPVTLQAVEDFQCPICQQFESTNADLLKSFREGDQVAVEYRPIAFLDRMSSTEYSTRALNASMCVLEDAGKDAWLTMHQSLYEQQPAEGGAGLPDADLVRMAKDAGASNAVESCIDDRRYDDWAAQQTKDVFSDGVTGTPTLFVNGAKLESSDTAAIQRAVTEAGAK
jgi:protein-disulfide isomerase